MSGGSMGTDAGNNLAHGQNFTINGSGFGSSIPVFAFNGGLEGDLEQTTVGNTPTSVANNGTGSAGTYAGQATTTAGAFNYQRFTSDVWGTTSSGPWAAVGNDATRGKCILSHLDAHALDGHGVIYSYEFSIGYKFNTQMASGSHYLWNWWMFGSWSDQNTSTDQFKWLRVMSQDTVNDTDNQEVWHNVGTQPGFIENPGAGDTGFFGHDLFGYFQPAGQWQRVEMMFIPGTVGNRDGQVNVRVFDGTGVPPYESYKDGSLTFDCRTQAENYHTASLYTSLMWQNGLFNGTPPVAGDFGHDDMYVSEGTFARVELWNDPNPANALHRESQRVTSWADTSISGKLNQGSMSAGTAYLVVLGDFLTDTVLASLPINITSSPPG